MQSFTARYDIYSPRWGHTDPYDLTFTSDQITIRQGIKQATCVLAEGGPVWQGHGARSKNPLLNILSDDSIYAPAVVAFAIEWAWERWRESAVEEQTLRDGLRELFGWVDAMARGKPSGPLWQGAF